jgi:hypothetical protein
VPDLLVPVSGHLFSPESLQRALDRTIDQLPSGASIGIGGAVDTHGATVALLFQSKDGHWQAKAAVEHDWTGDTRAAATFRFTK